MIDLHSGYETIWLVLLALALGVEGTAIRRKGKGDTLSELVWKTVRHPGWRFALGGLLGWLWYHFLVAGPGSLGLADVLVTAGTGLAGLLVRRKGATPS